MTYGQMLGNYAGSPIITFYPKKKILVQTTGKRARNARNMD